MATEDCRSDERRREATRESGGYFHGDGINVVPKSFPARANQPVRLFADESLEIDERAVEALRQIADLDLIAAPVVGLPDLNLKLRRGYIAPSGYVAIAKAICPGLMDSRVNCGMLLAATGIEGRDLTAERLDAVFSMARGSLRVSASETPRSAASLPPGRELLAAAPEMIAEAFGLSRREMNRIEGLGTDSAERTGLEIAGAKDIEGLPRELLDAADASVGVLGKGNHFVEIHEVEELLDERLCSFAGITKGLAFIAMHSDSVNVGETVRSILYPARKARGSGGILEKLGLKKRPPPAVPDAAPIMEAEEQERAARLIAAAHRFGTVNRLAIYSAVRGALAAVLGGNAAAELLGDFAHDTIFPSIGGRCWEHRKGAVRLSPGEAWPADPVLSKTGRIIFVPGAMGTAAHIGVALTPTPLAHSSCNHGAGRIFSRSESAGRFSEDEVRRELDERRIRIYRLGGEERLGELSRHGFRDPDRIAEYMERAGLAHLIAVLRPMAILKG